VIPWARGLAGLLLLAAGQATLAQGRVAPPPAAQDPSQLDAAVRDAVDALTRIVARRDLDGFKRHLRADTRISFGGDAGPEGLDLVWEPTRPDTKLWQALETILALGGVQQSDETGAPTWCAPWPSCIDVTPDPALTAYDVVVVTGTDVAVRAAPSTSAAVLGRASHEALVLAPGQQPEHWWAVQWRGGVGYVRGDLARSPVDQRITLRVDAQGWTVLYFVAGD
jgi:hypothetical protein